MQTRLNTRAYRKYSPVGHLQSDLHLETPTLIIGQVGAKPWRRTAAKPVRNRQRLQQLGWKSLYGAGTSSTNSFLWYRHPLLDTSIIRQSPLSARIINMNLVAFFSRCRRTTSSPSSKSMCSGHWLSIAVSSPATPRRRSTAPRR